MIAAYEKSYIDDAAQNLGELFDFLINYKDIDPDEAFRLFMLSKVGHGFEVGNPVYIAGHSGVELALMVLYETKLYWEESNYDWLQDKSPEYWAGWALAQYQCERNLRFEDMYKAGLTFSKTVQMYILHEADISKFYSECDSIIELNSTNTLNMLRRLRAYHNLTQKTLSEKSGVSLRMIQLYEQGQNSLGKAQASVVYQLAKALDCRIEDLL